MTRLDPKAFGLACGTLWSALMLLGTAAAVLTGYATGFYEVFTALYPGYSLSWPGVLIGAVYGFVDAFVGGWLLAWLYGRFAKT